MFDLFTSWLRKRGSCRRIYLGDADRPGEGLYLERYFIFRIPGHIGVFLHRFHVSDPDYVHDHPWSNISFCLGRYREHWHDGTYTDRRAGSIVFRPALMLHKIELLDGEKPWSLFVHFKRRRRWGFFRGNQWEDSDIHSSFKPLRGWIFPWAEDMRDAEA